MGGDVQNEVFVDDNAFGVPAVGNASEMFVRGIEGENLVRAQLLQAIPAIGAGVVRIDQAADARKVARLELCDCGADLGDPADYLVAGDNRVDSGHDVAPLVTHRVEVRVADAAEKNFDLHVAFSGIASRDCAGGQRRCGTGRGVSDSFIHGFILLLLALSSSLFFLQI